MLPQQKCAAFQKAGVAIRPGPPDFPRMALFIRRRSRPRSVPVPALLVLWGTAGILGMIMLLAILDFLTGAFLYGFAARVNGYVLAKLGWPLSSEAEVFLWLFQIACGGFVAGAGFGYYRLRSRIHKGGTKGGVPNENLCESVRPPRPRPIA